MSVVYGGVNGGVDGSAGVAGTSGGVGGTSGEVNIINAGLVVGLG